MCLMKESIQEVIENSDVVVVAKNDPKFAAVPNTIDGEKVVLDLVGAVHNVARASGKYEGICW